jgi:hypothetical protein
MVSGFGRQDQIELRVLISTRAAGKADGMPNANVTPHARRRSRYRLFGAAVGGVGDPYHLNSSFNQTIKLVIGRTHPRWS